VVGKARAERARRCAGRLPYMFRHRNAPGVTVVASIPAPREASSICFLLLCRQYLEVATSAAATGAAVGQRADVGLLAEGWRGECTDPTRADEPTSTSGGASTRGMARPDTSSAHHGNGGRTDHRARSGRRHRQSIPRPPPCLRPDARDARHASSWRLRALQKTFTDSKRRCDTTEDAQKRSQSIAGPHGRARTPGRRLSTSMNALRSCPSMDVLRAERQEIAHCTSLSLSPVHLRTTRVCSVSSRLRVALYSQQPLPLSPAHDDAERLWPMASRHAHTRPSRPVPPCMCSSSLDAVHPMAASDVACGHATPRRVYARESRSTPTLAPTPPPRRSSSPVERRATAVVEPAVERRHAGPCAQLCTRQGSCPPRPSFQIGSRDRSASETTTTGSHSLLDSLECRVLIGAVCVSSHASRGCRGICFDHCCLEVCRLSKFSFFDRYLLQSTRSRVGSRGLAVFRGVSAFSSRGSARPRAGTCAGAGIFIHSSSIKVHTVHGWCGAALLKY
jgi:hypothetical protein